MGRHSDGKPNYNVAKGPLILLLAVILIAALVFAWLQVRDSRKEEDAGGKNCVKGDLTLSVAADPAVAGLVRGLVDDWAATSPVVRDYCVRPQLAVNGSEQILGEIRSRGEGGDDEPGGPGGFRPVVPAVWAPADTSYVDLARDTGVVGVDGENAAVDAGPVGLAIPAERAADLQAKSWPELAAQADLPVATPGGPDAVVSAIVNAQLTPGDSAAVETAAAPRLAAAGDMTSETLLKNLADGKADGYAAVAATKPMVDAVDASGAHLAFISPQGSPTLTAPLVAFGSGGPIDETMARAGADFVKWARKSGGAGDAAAGPEQPGPLGGVVGEILPGIAAHRSDPGAGTTAPEEPAPAPAGSTLVLLDTSEGVDLDAVRGALDPLLGPAGTGDGRRVALWNYSSPMSPGVANPVRANVLFGDGSAERSADVLGTLGTGGQPWLWRSVQSAVDYAAEAWVPDVANRVVVVTSGRDDSGDDAAAAVDRIREAATTDRPVRVDVVVLGDDATDGALRRLAEETGGSFRVAGADLAGALTAAMGL